MLPIHQFGGVNVTSGVKRISVVIWLVGRCSHSRRSYVCRDEGGFEQLYDLQNTLRLLLGILIAHEDWLSVRF
jgi:hypothetical protein